MDADFRPRAADETTGRAPLKGEHSVTRCFYWCAHPLVARSGNLLEVGEETRSSGRPTSRSEDHTWRRSSQPRSVRAKGAGGRTYSTTTRLMRGSDRAHEPHEERTPRSEGRLAAIIR